MRYLVLVAGIALAWSAHAAPPTDAQARDIERMFGFDGVIQTAVQTEMASVELPSLTTVQKSCIQSGVAMQVEQSMLRSLASSFRDGDTVEAWKTFALTPGGRRTMEAMRLHTAAVAADTPGPDMKAAEASLTAEEKRDLATFAATPAASVMRSGMGTHFGLADGDINEITARSFASCGIQKR